MGGLISFPQQCPGREDQRSGSVYREGKRAKKGRGERARKHEEGRGRVGGEEENTTGLGEGREGKERIRAVELRRAGGGGKELERVGEKEERNLTEKRGVRGKDLELEGNDILKGENEGREES